MSKKSTRKMNKSMIIFWSVLGAVILAIAIVSIVSAVNTSQERSKLYGQWTATTDDGSTYTYTFTRAGRLNTQQSAEGQGFDVYKGYACRVSNGYIILDNEKGFRYTVEGDTLTLSGDTGVALVFTRNNEYDPAVENE